MDGAAQWLTDAWGRRAKSALSCEAGRPNSQTRFPSKCQPPDPDISPGANPGRAVLRDDIKNRESDRTVLLRIRLEREEGRYFASTSGKQQTGLLKTMVNSAAIAVIPPGRGFLAAGEEVDVHFFGSYIDLV